MLSRCSANGPRCGVSRCRLLRLAALAFIIVVVGGGRAASEASCDCSRVGYAAGCACDKAKTPHPWVARERRSPDPVPPPGGLRGGWAADAKDYAVQRAAAHAAERAAALAAANWMGEAAVAYDASGRPRVTDGYKWDPALQEYVAVNPQAADVANDAVAIAADVGSYQEGGEQSGRADPLPEPDPEASSAAATAGVAVAAAGGGIAMVAGAGALVVNRRKKRQTQQLDEKNLENQNQQFDLPNADQADAADASSDESDSLDESDKFEVDADISFWSRQADFAAF